MLRSSSPYDPTIAPERTVGPSYRSLREIQLSNAKSFQRFIEEGSSCTEEWKGFDPERLGWSQRS